MAGCNKCGMSGIGLATYGHGDPCPRDVPGGGKMLRVLVSDRTYAILSAISDRTCRNIEELCEAAIADEAIRSIPPQAR